MVQMKNKSMSSNYDKVQNLLAERKTILFSLKELQTKENIICKKGCGPKNKWEYMVKEVYISIPEKIMEECKEFIQGELENRIAEIELELFHLGVR